ncbi:MAG: hypothetical protein OXI16_00085 [Chloroflexota bacterium]|nr:hypothetical protein [Chloroflexota bacterium]
MATVEDVKNLSDKVQGVDSRVSRLEGGHEHLATRADVKEMENRLFVRLGLLIVVVGAVVAIVQRL